MRFSPLILAAFLALGSSRAAGQAVQAAPAQPAKADPAKAEPAKAEAGRPQSKFKQLGELALGDGDHDRAVSFFERYKNDSAASPAALKDAYLCLVDACCKAGKNDKAIKYADEHNAKFPPNPEVELLRARALLADGHGDKALAIFRKLSAEGAAKGGETALKAMFGEGMTLAQAKRWKEAAAVFRKLKSEGAGKKWETEAAKELIYCLVEAGDHNAANDEFKKMPKAEGEDLRDFKALEILLSVKKGDAEAVKFLYTELRKQAPEEAFPLLCAACMSGAELFLSKKDFQSATTMLKDAFVFAPGARERQSALKALANAYARADRKESALNAAEKYLEYYPDAKDLPEVRLQAARLCAELSKNDEACRLYELTIADQGADAETRASAALEAARLLAKEKNHPAAEKKCRQALELGKDNKTKAEAQLVLDGMLSQAGKHAEAGDAFLRTAEKYPEVKKSALKQSIGAFAKAGNYEKALGLAEKFLSQTGGDGEGVADVAYLKAVILEKSGDAPKACREYADFAAKYPNSPNAAEAMFSCGRVMHESGDYAGAARALADFMQKHAASPLAPRALYLGVYACHLSGQDAAAAKNVEALEQKHPGSEFTVGAMFWLADHLRDAGAFDKADAALERLLARSGDNPAVAAQAVFDRAEIARRAGTPDKALKLLDELFEKHQDKPVAADAHYLAGEICSEKGDHAQASAHYRKAAEQRPGSNLELAATGRIGDCLFSSYEKGRDPTILNQALEEYEKVLSRRGAPPQARDQALYKAGRCLELLGREAKAMEYYSELIYGYTVDRTGGGAPIWTVKAAQAATAIYLGKKTPESAKMAVKIYRRMMDMNSGLSEDYARIVEEIKKKYKI